MNAIVWQGGDRFEVQQVPTPTPGPGQVLVKVEAAAVCGSDSHLADFGATPPLIPGHEVAGTVVEAGAEAADVPVGLTVALDPVQRCGACWCCRHGIEHLCANCRHLGDGRTAGGWAEYVAIDAANAHPVPEGVDFLAAALTEPAAVCYQSLQRAQFRPGQSVLIVGDGPFGFLHAQIARALKAGKIVVAGHYDQRLRRITERTGAVGCNTHHQDLDALLAEEIDPPGVDVAVEATGAGGSPDLAIGALRPRGTLVVFSYIWNPRPMNMGLVHMRELNLVGSCRSLGAYGPCLEMMKQGLIDTGALVDIEAGLAECPQVLETLKADKANLFKAVFRPRAAGRRQ